MKKAYNITVKIIGIVVVAVALAGCAITEKDIQFTWDQMKDYYGDKDTPMPKIIVENKQMFTEEGYPVLGTYLRDQNLVVLYEGWGYETIIHEFHHALGNSMAEKKYIFVDNRLRSVTR